MAGLSNIIGVVFAAACLIFFLIKVYIPNNSVLEDVPLALKR